MCVRVHASPNKWNSIDACNSRDAMGPIDGSHAQQADIMTDARNMGVSSWH